MFSAGETQTMCRTDSPTFGKLTYLVCSTALDEAGYASCIDTFATNYYTNRDLVPPHLKNLFDGIVETGTNLIFSYCNMQVVQKYMSYFRNMGRCLPLTETSMDCTMPADITQSLAKCMYQANNGERIELFEDPTVIFEGPHRFSLLGDLYTYPEFLAATAENLSNMQCSEPVYYNYYFSGGGEGTVPQTPQAGPDGTDETDENGENIDRGASEPDSPDGPSRGSQDDIDRPSGGI